MPINIQNKINVDNKVIHRKTWKDYETDTTTQIIRKYDDLRAIKQNEITTATKMRAKLNGVKDECQKYESNIEYMVIMTYVSTLLDAIPPIKWMAVNTEGAKNSDIVNETWMSWLMKDKFLTTLYNTVQDSATCGVGYTYMSFLDDQKEIQYATYKSGKKTIKKGKKRTYYGPKTMFFPFENVFLNGTTLDSSTEVIITSQMSFAEFESSMGVSLSAEKLEAIKYEGANEFTVEKADILYIEKEVVDLVEYYNTMTNEHCVMANKVIINTDDGNLGVNPYPHCQVPISEFVYSPVNTHAFGKPIVSLVQDEIRLYNVAMQKILQIAELSVGITTMEDTDDILVESHPLLGTILKGNAEDIQFKNPQYAINIFEYIASTMMRNAILKTIDFANQITENQYETSTSVNYRKSSSEKRVNMMIKYNMFSYFYRMCTQWLSLMQNQYDFKEEPLIITTKGKTMEKFAEATITTQTENDSFYEVGYQDIVGAYEIFPDVDKSIGPNQKEKTEESIAYITLLGNIKKSDGTPLLNPEDIAKLAMEGMRYNLNMDTGGINIKDQSIEQAQNELFGTPDTTVPQQEITQMAQTTGIPVQGSLSA